MPVNEQRMRFEDVQGQISCIMISDICRSNAHRDTDVLDACQYAM